MIRSNHDDRMISKQRLLQMLSRRRSEPIAMPSEGDKAPLVDWKCPHHFAPREWQLLRNLGKKIAAFIEKALGPVCLEEPKVTLKKVVQDLACVLAEQTLKQEKVQYFLPIFAQGKSAEGYLNIQTDAACVLVAQLLRDSEAIVAQNGCFSSLEESILHDGVIIIADAFMEGIKEYSEIALRKGEQIIKSDWPLEKKQIQDLCGFIFELAFSDKKIEIRFMFLSEILDQAVGITPQAQKTLNTAELSRMIVRQLHDASVEVCAQVCISSVRMEDLMKLEAGDVVVLNKKVKEPIDILLNKRISFQAWPATCEGKLALMISQIKK